MSVDLKLSPIAVSKIIPYYMIPYGVGALLYAPLAKKVSIKTIMVVSMIFLALSNFLCAFTHSLAQLLFFRVMMGIVAASVIPLGLIIIGKSFEAGIRGRMVGTFFSASFVASMVGIILSGLIDWRWLFFIPTFLGLGAAIFVGIFRSDLLKKIDGKPIDYLNVFYDREIRNVFIFIFFVSMFYHGVYRWLGVYLDQVYHLQKFAISIFFVLRAMGGILGRNIGGQLTDRRGRYGSCLVGIVILSGATMLLYGIFPLYILAMIFVASAVGWTIGHNGLSTVLTDFPDERRSEIASLNSSVRFLSGGAGFSLSGFFVEKNFGFGLTFLTIGILMFFSSLFLRKIVPVNYSTKQKGLLDV